jgi:glycosyltransferase involved in cell wall biosynthesis
VIATTESPLPDLLGAGGVFIKPNTDELLDALERVLRSPRMQTSLRDAGLQAAGRLSWDAAATQMREVIEKVAAR